MRYTLQVDEGVDRAAIDRCMNAYRERCPVYRSISAAIAFSDEIELVPA